jgi:hypothetical protein
MKKKEESLQTVFEDVTYLLNNIRNEKFKVLEKTKLTPAQQKVLDNIEKDLEACVTKIGLVLHSTEL